MPSVLGPVRTLSLGTAASSVAPGYRLMVASQRAWSFTVEPDYAQFYALRSGAEWASDRVPSAGYEAHLWSDGGFVYIGTARRYGTTSVTVEVLGESPADIAPEWQHVAEVSLDAGGDLQVCGWDPEPPAAVVPIEGAPMRLRVHWTGLTADRYEGLDEHGDSDERLLLQLWPAAVAPARVVRWWPEWELPPLADTSDDGRRQAEGLEAVLERLPTLELVKSVWGSRPPGVLPMPGGRENSSVGAVLHDSIDDSWWVDGYDVRRTLREVSEEEARAIVAGSEDAND